MSLKRLTILLTAAFITTITFAQHERLGGYKFIENKNQWPEQVAFRSDIQGGYFYVEKDGFLFDLYDGKTFNRYVKAHYDKSYARDVDELKWQAYKVRFANANSNVTIDGDFETPEYYNYFLGNDPTKWASKAKGYHRIKYNDLYNGIDLNLYSKIFNLKYDFIVSPGADVSQIQLQYEGANEVAIKNERLHIYTDVNHIIEDKPYAYQIINGVKTEVECHYQLKGNKLSFKFPKGYNKNVELVIDPTLMFSTYSGSFSNNFGYSATFDSKGFLYSGSSAFGNQYPTTTGAYSTTFSGGIVDIAISKFDTTGTFLLYSTYLGGTTSDELPHSLIVNSLDELFILGTTSSTDYPYTTGCYDSTFAGGTPNNLTQGLGVNYVNGSDLIVSHLSNDGATLMASTYIGGTANDGLNSTNTIAAQNILRYNYADEVRGEIDIDANDNIFIVSCTRSTDFPIVGNVFQPTYGGGPIDGCVIKMDNGLQNIIWSSFLGGENHDAAYSLALDDQNDIYVTGGTESTLFPYTSGVLDTAFQGGRCDGFVTHITSDGQQIINSTYYGSPEYDQSYFVELDHFNNVYLLGQTEETGNQFIHNVLWSNPGSGQFVSKINPGLDSLIYSTVFGSGNGINISPTAFLVDLCSKMYLAGWGGAVNNLSTLDNNAGYTNNMPTTFDAFQSTTDGSDFYVMVLEDDGSNIVYGSYFGGTTSSEHVDGGTSRFDRKGKVYQAMCAGCGFNSDLPIEPPNAVSPNNNNSCNLGVFKMDFNLPVVVADFETPPIGCAPYTYSFINTSLSQNYTSFDWDFGDGNTSTQQHPTHTYNQAGTYTITLVVNDTATCNFGDTIQKDITIMGDTSFAIANEDICPGNTVQIGTLPNPNPDLTYSWVPSNYLSDSTVSNPFATPPSTTNYTLLISNGICTDTIYQTVVVNTPLLDVSNDTILCSDSASVTLWANSFGTSSEYTWSTNDNFTDTINSPTTDPTITVSPSVPTMYYVSINNNGCYAYDSVFVALATAQSIITADTAICEGDSIQLTVTNLIPTDTLTYDWGPDALILSGEGTNTVWVMPSTTTTFTCVSENNMQCIMNNSVTVTVDPLPSLSTTAWADSDTIYEGTNTTLHVEPNGYSYTWSPAGSLSDPNSQNPIAAPESTTSYIVTISGDGCEKEDTVTIYVEEVICGQPDLYIPNAFTPNSDGVNDVLYVRGNNFTEILFRVYDRWGELVFETTDQNIGWDGTFEGRDCDPAVFDYYLEVQCINEDRSFHKGNVTLIR